MKNKDKLIVRNASWIRVPMIYLLIFAGGSTQQYITIPVPVGGAQVRHSPLNL